MDDRTSADQLLLKRPDKALILVRQMAQDAYSPNVFSSFKQP